MMDYFLEFRVLPDPEFSSGLLMSALYNKLHRALASMDAQSIGVSLPDYDDENTILGTRLRLHGTHDHLSALMEQSWLRGMHDHIRFSRILEVPTQVNHARFSRVQTRPNNVERIRRRQMRRHDLTYEQAVQRVPEETPSVLNLPFFTVQSRSSEQKFKLFIQRQWLESPHTEGRFNTYGLSREVSVPIF